MRVTSQPSTLANAALRSRRLKRVWFIGSPHRVSIAVVFVRGQQPLRSEAAEFGLMSHLQCSQSSPSMLFLHSDNSLEILPKVTATFCLIAVRVFILWPKEPAQDESSLMWVFPPHPKCLRTHHTRPLKIDSGNWGWNYRNLHFWRGTYTWIAQNPTDVERERESVARAWRRVG